MLRSIFSLIQNIIDSDKDYNNKKSNTVIYLMSNSDNSMNMDLEIDGKGRENLKSIEKNDSTDSASFKITTEQGDTVTCRHFTDKDIRPKSADTEKLQEEYKQQVTQISERASFNNEEEVEERHHESGQLEGDKNINVQDLLRELPQKEIKTLGKDRDQLHSLLEQIQKMKKGMERLQEIAQQFKCSEKFKQDIEFLIKNVAPALEKGESKQTNLSTKEP